MSVWRRQRTIAFRWRRRLTRVTVECNRRMGKTSWMFGGNLYRSYDAIVFATWAGYYRAAIRIDWAVRA